MPDQLLRAHEMMEYVYNLADVGYPVSIRDQMNRARWLVEKAYDLGFFGPTRKKKYCRLLVCGAGAGGVTAALHALSLGVETVLVEQSPAPFLRQRLCTSRWIDPTQYDWSADHWITGRFPHAGPRMPLPWHSSLSHHLAIGWHLRLRSAIRNPLLTFRRRERVVGAPVPIPSGPGTIAGVRVTFSTGATEDFGMMLWAIGFGDERRFARPNYTGFAFWDTDPFEQPHWGISSPPPELCALVSGGGDGGLQDVIRLVAGKKSALDLYQSIVAAGWTMPAKVRHQLFTAEDQAQRALLWCQPKSADEHKALQELHNAYVDAVDEVINRDPQSGILISEVRNILSANLHPVLLVHPCTHFARGYGLNHFLVLLLSKVASLPESTNGLNILADHVVTRVSGASAHASGCANRPWACHGQLHDVDVETPYPCFELASKSTTTTKQAHVVVIRHGISTTPAFAGAPMAFARQVMPYHLP